MLPTRKRVRGSRLVTPPSTRPVTPPTASRSEFMAGLTDSSSDSSFAERPPTKRDLVADPHPAADRPQIHHDIVADAQPAVHAPVAPSHVTSERPAIQSDVVVAEEPAVTPPASPSGGDLAGSHLKPPSEPQPPSPSQREAFLASLHVQKVTTNLSSVNALPGARLNFEGTIIVVYPAESNPARRHVLLADEHGVCGITFWNANVSKFSGSIVGTIAQVSKVIITSHLGKKSLSMNKESGLVISNKIAPFWTQLLDNPVSSIMQIHSMPIHKFVSVAGILGVMHSEMKIVRNEEKELVILRIVDRTGSIEVQSWVSKLSDFERFRDRPILLKRVKVSEFSGVKFLEFIDGNGTHLLGDFEGANDLTHFWKEPAKV